MERYCWERERQRGEEIVVVYDRQQGTDWRSGDRFPQHIAIARDTYEAQRIVDALNANG